MEPTPAERAVSILTAYCASRIHDGKNKDIAGIALFDLIAELEDFLLDAEGEEEIEAAREIFEHTIVNLLGITESLLDYLEVDPFDMIPTIVQENLWRENVADRSGSRTVGTVERNGSSSD